MLEGLCNKDCNSCPLIGHGNSKMLSAIFNTLRSVCGDDGERVYEIVNSFCSNLTVCPECRIDDFCHIDHSDEQDDCLTIRATREYYENNKVKDDGSLMSELDIISRNISDLTSRFEDIKARLPKGDSDVTDNL